MATRQQVFSAVSDERVFQDRKWGTIEDHPHEVGSWLTIMRQLLNDAECAYISQRGDFGAIDELRKVVAVGVACMEQHGVVPRPPIDFVEQSKNYTVHRANPLPPNAWLRAKAIDHETKHDVAVSTLEIVKEGRLSAQKALFAQCEETKKLTEENARLQSIIHHASQMTNLDRLERDRLRAALEDAKEGIISFGNHAWDCKASLGACEQDCTCWHQKSIDAIKEALKGHP